MHRRLRSHRTTRTYLVLTGTFTFTVEDQAVRTVPTGDVLVLPPGTAYGLAGRGSYLVLNTPAFAHGDDEYLDGAPAPARGQLPEG